MEKRFIGPVPKECVGGPVFASILKPPATKSASVFSQSSLSLLTAVNESRCEDPQEEQKSPAQGKKCILRIKKKPSAPQNNAPELPQPIPQSENPKSPPYSLQSSADRIIVTNLSDLFTCQGCKNEFEQWMLYIDVPCPNLCRICHRCLHEQKSCPVCLRSLSAEEQQMVLIYYQSFLSSDWSAERILEEAEKS